MARHVEIYVKEVVKETDAAFLFVTEGDEEVWIPKSQMENEICCQEGDTDLEVSVTRWIAEEKGLI